MYTHTRTGTCKHQLSYLPTLTATRWCLPGLCLLHKPELPSCPVWLAQLFGLGGKATSNTRLACIAPASPSGLAQGPVLAGFPEGYGAGRSRHKAPLASMSSGQSLIPSRLTPRLSIFKAWQLDRLWGHQAPDVHSLLLKKVGPLSRSESTRQQQRWPQTGEDSAQPWAPGLRGAWAWGQDQRWQPHRSTSLRKGVAIYSEGEEWDQDPIGSSSDGYRCQTWLLWNFILSSNTGRAAMGRGKGLLCDPVDRTSTVEKWAEAPRRQTDFGSM